jgi:hypothetical protein
LRFREIALHHRGVPGFDSLPSVLDDLGALRISVERYRESAVAAGVSWRDMQDREAILPVGELCRVLDIECLPEQPVWLNGAGLPYARVLPCGAFPLMWHDAGEVLNELSASVAVPFHWRHQLPLLSYERIVFTFVLADGFEGEIWRYQFEPDEWNPVRAATSLVAMFEQWNKGFAADVYARGRSDHWLMVESVEQLLRFGLDPCAFPKHISQVTELDLLRERQVACGVDLNRADDFDALEELGDEVSAVQRSLRR